MANKIQIVLHSLPREIDEVKRIVDQLARSQFYIGDTNNVILDFTLNVSDKLTDWENSKIPKEYFIDKFTYIESLSPFVNRFDVSDTCLGCNDKRRNAINSDTDATHILYLDTDVYFSDYNLTMMFDAISQIKNKYHIISSEILQLWDSSWDVISNERTRNTDRSKKLWHTNPYRVFDRREPCIPKLRQIQTVKFGGGWFNLFNIELLKFITIPDSLGPYGLDDTFIAEASMHMLRKGYDIRQYVLSDMIVIEDRMFRNYPYDNYVKTKSDMKDFWRKESHKNYSLEMEKFLKRI